MKTNRVGAFYLNVFLNKKLFTVLYKYVYKYAAAIFQFKQKKN
jgi:hypothetical protein